MDLEAILAYSGLVIILNGISLLPLIWWAIKEKHYTRRNISGFNGLLIAGNGILMVVVNLVAVNPNAIVLFIGAMLIIIGFLSVGLIVNRSINSFRSLHALFILFVVIVIQMLTGTF